MRATLGVLAALGLSACATPRPVAPRLPGDAHLLDPDARPFVAAERYRGHVVLLDFWAGWCDACKRAAPQVARLAAAFAPDGLVVIGVDAGEPPGDAVAYARALHLPYPIALDPDLAFSDRLGARDLPMFVVVDRGGAIVHRTRHVDAALLAAIRRALHARAVSPSCGEARTTDCGLGVVAGDDEAANTAHRLNR